MTIKAELTASQPFLLGCPACRQILRADFSMSGQTISCPHCKGAMVVPRSAPRAETAPDAEIESDTATTNLVLAFAIVIGHVVAWLVFSLWIGICLATLLSLVSVVICFAIFANVGSSSNSGTTERRKKSGSRPIGPPARHDVAPVIRKDNEPRLQNASPVMLISPPRPAPADTSTANAGLRWSVEVSGVDDRANLEPRRGEPIPPPARNQSVRPANKVAPLNQLGARLPLNQILFFGPQTSLTLDRGMVTWPMVYATASPQFGAFDASLIDGSLQVANELSYGIDPLPYWPSYSDATPFQRSRYLDWLVSGRSDPRIEIGYVFIYFYGLERRALVDDADHEAIIEELLRLRGIYQDSRSFQRYATSLLWLIVGRTSKRQIVSDEVVKRIVTSTDRWDDELLNYYLACVHDLGRTLTAEMAFVIAQHDHRTPTSAVVRRHEQKFRELFATRFESQFPEGLSLRSSKRPKSLTYRPASSTLLNLLGMQKQAFGTIPDVMAISSQFKPLVEIWNQSIEGLREFDRAHRKHGELSAAAFESLPEELQTGDHPEFDQWFALWQESENTDNVPVVKISHVASLKSIVCKASLTKSQCRQILETADCLGIGVEPDARLTGKNYRSDDVVTFFFLEDERDTEFASYQATAALLQLGIHLAGADGQIDEVELSAISRHIEDQFNLSPNQVKRLTSLRLLVQHTKPDPARILASLRQKLSEEQRIVVSEFLIGIAAADQVITAAEMETLRRLFAALGLSADRIHSLISPIQMAQPTEPVTQTTTTDTSEFHLDLSAISRIMRDTEAVATILKQAMDVDDEEAESIADEAPVGSKSMQDAPVSTRNIQLPTSATISATVSGADLLAPRFRPFFNAIVTRPDWSQADAKELAKQHNVMLSGAIEAINEWSQDRWNDWLIEEGDTLLIRLDLLERK